MHEFFSEILLNNSLLIKSVKLSDEGVFQCAVSVTLKRQYYEDTTVYRGVFLSRRATLDLPSIQRFEYHPTNKAVLAGQPVSFRCIVVRFCVLCH